MRVFLNEIVWKQKLDAVPAALRPKFISEFEESGRNLGIESVSGEAGQMQVNIKGSAANFFRWAEDTQVVAVEIEAGDIVPLLGRTMDALVLKRGIERGVVKFDRLEMDEIMTTLRETAWGLQATSEEPEDNTGGGVFREMAEDDLLKAGFVSKRDLDTVNNPFPNESRYSGMHGGGRPLSYEGSEWSDAPDASIDPFNS